MTARAARLGEFLHAGDLLRCQSLLVPLDVAAVGAVGGDQGAFVGGDRLGEVLDVHHITLAECLLEIGLVTGDGFQAVFDQGLVILDAHLDGVDDRPLGLLFQGGFPSIPELNGKVGGIPHRGGTTASFLALYTHSDGTVVFPAQHHVVAAVTRDGAG